MRRTVARVAIADGRQLRIAVVLSRSGPSLELRVHRGTAATPGMVRFGAEHVVKVVAALQAAQASIVR